MKVVTEVPCYNCPKRAMRCHSACKEYKEYVLKKLEKRNKVETHWNKNQAFYSYCEDRTKRLKRFKGRH